MRELLMLVTLAACGVDQVEQHRSIVKVDGSELVDVTAAEPQGSASVPACAQLVAGDDAMCSLWCTDWDAFAAMAQPGACASAECPLQNGSTFSPTVCLDPH